MNPVAPEVYRAALSKLDLAKEALRAVAAIGGDQATIALTALGTIRNADAWDKCRCSVKRSVHRPECPVALLLKEKPHG